MKSGATNDNSPAIKETFIAVILAISFGHLLNDFMQSMLPAIYPLLSINYNLSLLQIGIITATYQSIGSVLQPLIGIYTDKNPLPCSLLFAFAFMMIGLLLLANSFHYCVLLFGAACIGFGSSIFHPEASRITRLASGGRYGFAQSIFQVGGNTGTALGPLVAALFIIKQDRLAWLTVAAFIGFLLLTSVCRWYAGILKKRISVEKNVLRIALSKKNTRRALLVLIALMFTKYVYLASMSNFYTFFSMEKYGINLHQAQYLLFLYLGGIAIGTVFGGPMADRVGAGPIIWISILGVLPFTLVLPHVSLTTMAVLSVIIGLILASAFPAILVFAQELMPGKVGTVAGLFFGLSFGIGAIASAGLGAFILLPRLRSTPESTSII